jgi:hypothetical protein
MSTKLNAKPIRTSIKIDTSVDTCSLSTRFLLDLRTAAQLKEDLRTRKLPIPKDKGVMVERLARALSKQGAVITATIG